MRSFLSLSRIAPALAIVALALAPAGADTIAYSNLDNYTGSGYANDGAANVGGDTITTLVADDITLDGPAGQTITGFSWTMGSFATAAVTAGAQLRFYDLDPGTGAPTTLLATIAFGPVTLDPNSFGIYSVTLDAASQFVIPGTTFWAGIAFDDGNGTTGATAADLNNLAQGIFDPPTVGSSQDVFFQTDVAGSYLTDNPSGSFLYFGGNPVASFGWEFTTAVPEPSSAAMAGLALALALGAAVGRLRSRPSRAATAA